MSKLLPTPALHCAGKNTRRSVLKVLLTGAAALGLGQSRAFGSPTPGPTGKRWTPKQTEGPFYPIIEQADKDVDLTRIQGHSESAQGEVIRVQGRVLDTEGAPLSNAFVEIWQANTWGRYSHKRDPNTAPLDPNFQGWGQTRTDTDGHYGFKTILPGAYPAGPDWTRPPHIHFKAAMQGFYPLTTQMYFPGHKLNASDLILQNLSRPQQEMVIAKRRDSDQNGAPVFVFDIVLLALD